MSAGSAIFFDGRPSLTAQLNIRHRLSAWRNFCTLHCGIAASEGFQAVLPRRIELS
jgi:hypothetical protein